ncbi:hypothetical protein CR513_37336, partial [Mucuna pruriens]
VELKRSTSVIPIQHDHEPMLWNQDHINKASQRQLSSYIWVLALGWGWTIIILARTWTLDNLCSSFSIQVQGNVGSIKIPSHHAGHNFLVWLGNPYGLYSASSAYTWLL